LLRIGIVEVGFGVGVVGLEIRCGNVDITLVVDFVGSRIEKLLTRNVNEAGVTGDELTVLVGTIVVLTTAGVLVGIVENGIIACAEFMNVDAPPTDKRARPSSRSTRIDARLRDRRPLARRPCLSCGFIVCFPDVIEINPKPA
jgi:hypothetical protein